MFDLGNATIRRFLSTVDNPRKVERARVPNYSWPPEIQGLNSAREHRRAHMKAVLWHEQVVLDNSDQALIGGDACVFGISLYPKDLLQRLWLPRQKSRNGSVDSCLIPVVASTLLGCMTCLWRKGSWFPRTKNCFLRTANGKTSTMGLARLKVDGNYRVDRSICA